MSSAALLLHPVRMRIIEAFLGDRALTTTQLRAELPDVPPTSLYRHVARLVNADVLSVVVERRVRGAVERTYVLRPAAARITPDEVATMTVGQQRQAFLAFIAGLLGDFDRYLARDNVDPARDGASFNLAGMWLTDTELMELARELQALLLPRLANPRKRNRKRHVLATVLLPDTPPPRPAATARRKPKS